MCDILRVLDGIQEAFINIHYNSCIKVYNNILFYYDYSLLNVYEMLYLGKRATRITKKLGSGIKEKGEENVLYVKS